MGYKNIRVINVRKRTHERYKLYFNQVKLKYTGIRLVFDLVKALC